jgi:hypothetical protein
LVFLCAAVPGVSEAARRPLLIYYADETTPQAARSANYAALLSVLKQSHSALAAEVASSVVQDAHDFPLAVQSDVAALFAASRRLGFDLAVFTNARAMGGQYLLLKSGDAGFETRSLPPLPAAANSILANSPLSRADYFRAALDAVGAQYPPDTLDVVLITNSHGDEETALTPRVFADLSFAKASDVLTRLDQASPSSGPRPQWAREQGVSKADYWRAIDQAGADHGIHFDLVFRDACRSGASSLAELMAIPQSVAAIANTGDNNIGENDIDFAAAFATERRPEDLANHLAAALRQHGVYVDARPMMWIRALWDLVARSYTVLLFIPLAVWAVWMGASLFARRRAAAPGQAGAA